MLLFPVPSRLVTAQHSTAYCIQCLAFRHLLDFSLPSYSNKGVSYNILLQWHQMLERKTVKDFTMILRDPAYAYQRRVVNGNKQR